jgi:hypothetical protein
VPSYQRLAANPDSLHAEMAVLEVAYHANWNYNRRVKKTKSKAKQETIVLTFASNLVVHQCTEGQPDPFEWHYD